MLNIIDQIYYSAKRLIMDTKPLLIRLVSYMLIILILGTALGKAFNTGTLDKIRILYCNKDSGKLGSHFISSMTEVEEIKSLVSFEKASSFDEAKELINHDKADALVYIPESFSNQAIVGDKSKTIEVYRKKDSSVNAVVVQNVLDSFISGMNTAGVIDRMTGGIKDYLSDQSNVIKEVPLSNEKPESAMEYYAVAMLLMLILTGADIGRIGIGEDYLGVFGDRLKLSPLKPFEQYTGKIIGLSSVTFLLSVIIILFTKYVYGVNWGNNFALLLIIVFSYAVLTTTFGAMLSVLTKDLARAGSIVAFAIVGFTFLAGGFVVMDFGIVGLLSPSYYARSAIYNIVYNGDSTMVYFNIGVIWAITLMFTVISIISAGRKKA